MLVAGLAGGLAGVADVGVEGRHVSARCARRSGGSWDAFYSGVLDMTEVPKPPVLARRGGVWFRTNGVELHLGVEQDFRPARKAHPAFVVDGLDSRRAPALRWLRAGD
jgi:hypothetical protein